MSEEIIMDINYRRSVILLTKDILRSDYLGCYSDKAVFPTPNIDSLAKNGTIFHQHITSAPSSGMAATCMFAGLSAHELERKSFKHVEQFRQCETLFNILEKERIETHVLWSHEFEHLAYVYSRIFDPATNIHFAPAGGAAEPEPQKAAFKSSGEKYDLADYFVNHIKNIAEANAGYWFVWCHCPHIFQPRDCYGADIDLFDELVGRLNAEIDADLIVTGDHAHMKGEKGKVAYGFDVYEPAIKLPLIMPDWFGIKEIDYPTESSQLKDIIIFKHLEQREFVYSDTKYYEQPDRRTTIRKGDYKLIYNKSTKSEELYDLDFDPHENINLLILDWPDFDRNTKFRLEHIIHYPKWDDAEITYKDLKAELDRIWKTGSIWMTSAHRINDLKNMGIKKILRRIIQRKPKQIIVRGRWGSRARYQ